MKQLLIKAGAVALALCSACTAEQDLPQKGQGCPLPCGFSVTAGAGWTPETKSTLTTDGIDTLVTDLVLAAYRDGIRFATAWFPDPSQGDKSLLLQKGRSFHIYALANMGDLRSQLPLKESDLPDFSVPVPSYCGSATSVNARGIPMAGYLPYIARPSSSSRLVLERLLAKVNVHLQCDWPGGRITRVAVKNLNGTLKPFGDSAAQGADDLYGGTPEQENVSGEGRDVELVLYVPENRQGTIAGISSSGEKSPDHSAEVESRKDLLSYLEVSVMGSSLYRGTMIYRNLLGNNATDDFDIRRNTSYSWNIIYYEDNLSMDEWKYGNHLTDCRTLDLQGPILVCAGDTVSLGGYVSSNIPLDCLRWTTRKIAGKGVPIGQVLCSDDLGKPNLVVAPDAQAGERQLVYISPKANVSASLLRSTSLQVVDSDELEFQRAGSGISYPYQKVQFDSPVRYTKAAAQAACNALTVEYSTSDILSGITQKEVCHDDDGYFIRVTLVPTRPGPYAFTLSNSRGSRSLSFSVSAPRVTPSTEHLHLDIRGGSQLLYWQLTDPDTRPITPEYQAGDSRFSLTLEDPYGTDITLTPQSVDPASFARYSASVRGLGGLVGLDPFLYTFQGLTVKAVGTYTYPNGYAVSHSIRISIDDPMTTLFGSPACTYAVQMGSSQTDEFVSATPEYYPEYMLDWPSRTITADLSRHGSRTVPADLELWLGPACNLNKTRYYLSGTQASFVEDLGQWGPVCYGKTLTNSYSQEQVRVPHSILRIYDHYNVFATFDAQQQPSAMMQAVWGSMDWSVFNGRAWGCFRADYADNFAKGPYADMMSGLVLRTCSQSTAPAPIFQGFYKTDDIPSGEAGNFFYRTDGIPGFDGWGVYYIGYYNEPRGYDIYYRLIDVTDWEFLEVRWDLVNWRVIAAANQPQFVISGGSFTKDGRFRTPARRTGVRTYNFSIMSLADHNNGLDDKYLDPNGLGYQFVHPFWEERAPLETVSTKKLNAARWPASQPTVSLFNGWYDPSLYYSASTPSQNGVPPTSYLVGMYFYVPGALYYNQDNPTNFSTFNAVDPAHMDDYYSFGYHSYVPKLQFRNGMEWISFGTLAARERNATR